MTKETTVEEKIHQLRQRRSFAEKEYRKFVAANGEGALRAGQGKGREPKPWCECHNRNPCPIEKELNK